jgi:hypothetical protein
MIWPVLKEKAQEQGLPLTTVTAEVLHLVVLDVIFGVPESQSICFQGGTSIHQFPAFSCRDASFPASTLPRAAFQGRL